MLGGIVIFYRNEITSIGKLTVEEKIELHEKITQAVEKGQFLVLPRVTAQIEEEKIRSAIVAPIIGSTGCLGVLYVDNALDHEHYSLSDLDYLMLIAIHTASVLDNF